MMLIIDNYDSFTYNLVQYFGELGVELTVRRNDQITLPEIANLQPDRICISPGPGGEGLIRKRIKGWRRSCWPIPKNEQSI